MSDNNGLIIERAALVYPRDCYESTGAKLKEEYAYLDTVVPSRITYWSDDQPTDGFLIKPKQAGSYPCIICNRGGNRDFAAIDSRAVVHLLSRVASWGYVVIASQYRGYGSNKGRDEFGGRDMNDVMNLFPLLDTENGADSSRIGMYGGSRGGMMTCLALARTDRILAAAVRCGVTDLTDWGEDRKDMKEVFKELIPGFESNEEATLIARSAVYWTEKFCKRTPILLLQGAADWRVNPVSVLRFAERLLAVHHPFRLVLLEGADHALTEHIAERDRQMRDWFDRYVRDKSPLPIVDLHGD